MASSISPDTWNAFLGMFEAKESGFAAPGDLARKLDPRTVQTPALELVDKALVDLAEGRTKRLIISISPQEGKSERISRRFPLWMLLRNPDLRIAIASYEATRARRWGRVVRNDIKKHPELGLKISSDRSAAYDWGLEGSDGSLYCVGVGGALTGSPVDCLHGDTPILTERGYTSIRDIHQSGTLPRVLSYDHATNRAQWRAALATRAIPDRPLVEVVTSSGRQFTCTPDHLVATADGYRSASLLRPGDRLTVGWSQHAQGVHRLREGPQEPRSHLPRLLHGGPGVDVSDAGVHVVRDRVPAHAGRGREEAQSRSGGPLLLDHVRGEGAQGTGASVPAVWAADGVEGPAPSVLRRPVPNCGEGQEDQTLSAVRADLRVRQCAAHLLRPGLCQRGPFDADDRDWELALQDRDQLRAVVPAYAAADLRAGRPRMPGLPGTGHPVSGDPGWPDSDADEPGRAPRQRATRGQPAGEFDPALQDLPYGAPQVGEDTVHLVRDLRGERDTVYDLQVEGNHNFFAGEVLVHNCMIIDDPHKGHKEADSETQRDDAWEWWTGTVRTRFSPETPIVLVMTRWHEDDLAGRMIRDDPLSWTVINLPARADHRPERGETDPLGREPGEFLISTRGRHLMRPVGSCKKHKDRECCDWEDIESDVGSRTWSALYQGRPSPGEGLIFNREWWQYYSTPQWIVEDDGTHLTLTFDEVIESWDMAFKDTDSSDFVVGQVWGRRGADAYLLDQVRGRMSFVETCMQVRSLSAKWPSASAKLVEDKANGPAVINALSKNTPGLVAVQPEGSKLARASAVSPFCEAKNVWLPEFAPFTPQIVDECASFPLSANDDMVDALSQALSRLLLNAIRPRVRFL